MSNRHFYDLLRYFRMEHESKNHKNEYPNDEGISHEITIGLKGHPKDEHNNNTEITFMWAESQLTPGPFIVAYLPAWKYINLYAPLFATLGIHDARTVNEVVEILTALGFKDETPRDKIAN